MADSSSSDRSLPLILLALTAGTGIVDAVSFLGLGRVFTANMTGNVVFLAFAAAGAADLSVPRSLAALAGFFAGAVVGGRFATRMGASSRRRWISTALVVETGLLLAATASAIGFQEAGQPTPAALYAVIILTALAMGVRNATVRKLGVADLTTTVLTLTVAGLAADSSLAGGGNYNLFRRVGSVVMMFGGAVVGALLLKHSLVLPLIVCSAISGLAATAVLLGATKEVARAR